MGLENSSISYDTFNTQVGEINTNNGLSQQSSLVEMVPVPKATEIENIDLYNTNIPDTNRNYGVATDGGPYDDNNSYVNTKNGVTYKLYDQGLGAWSGYVFDDGQDMRAKGCMLTAAATIASATDSSITPGDFFDTYRHDYVETSVYLTAMGGFYPQPLAIDNETNQAIITNLEHGNPSIIMVKGGNGDNKFTSDQHYMALLDISADGKLVFVGNSHVTDGGDYSSNGWYPIEEVLKNVEEATIFTPTTVLKKFNS